MTKPITNTPIEIDKREKCYCPSCSGTNNLLQDCTCELCSWYRTVKTKPIEKKLDLSHMIHWDYIDNSNVFGPKLKDNEVVLISYEYFKAPMWLFHILRKLSLWIDRIPNIPREIINNLTVKYDIQDGYKLPKDYFNL